MEKIRSFFNGIKKELGRVRWPKKQEMFKYSIITILFIVFFALFFAILDLIIAAIKTGGA